MSHRAIQNIFILPTAVAILLVFCRGYTKAFMIAQNVEPIKGGPTHTTLYVDIPSDPIDADLSSTNWNVDLYQDKHSFVWKYGESLIDLLNPQPGEHILDVGCGSGELTFQIAKRVGLQGVVLGIDSDANMIERALRQQQQQIDNTNVIFFQGDVRKFSLPNTSEPQVHAIFSNAALHWVQDASAAIGSMSRALKIGGRLIVEFGGKGNVDDIVQASNQVLGRHAQHNPWYFPSIGDYSTLLEKVGNIEVTNAVLFDRPTPLKGSDGMKRWLDMFGGVLLESDDDNHDKIVDEIVNLLRPKLYDGNKWIADYRRIRIVGIKKID